MNQEREAESPEYDDILDFRSATSSPQVEKSEPDGHVKTLPKTSYDYAYDEDVEKHSYIEVIADDVDIGHSKYRLEKNVLIESAVTYLIFST